DPLFAGKISGGVATDPATEGDAAAIDVGRNLSRRSRLLRSARSGENRPEHRGENGVDEAGSRSRHVLRAARCRKTGSCLTSVGQGLRVKEQCDAGFGSDKDPLGAAATR